MNPFREAVLRTLQQPATKREEPEEDLHAKPREISDQELTEIDKLPTKAAACELALDINANIELLEFKTDVAARAEKLEYLRRANLSQRCRHVMSNGDTCGCPALRDQQYCRFHGQAYESEIDLPVIEDVDSLQIAYMSLAKRIAAGKIAAAEAKVLLQVIDRAAENLEHYAQD